MMTITRVGPLSAAKVAGVLYVLIGLVIGAFVSLFAMAAGGMAAAAGGGDNGAAAAFGSVLFGVGAIVILPIFYGCIGFFATLIMAALFNVVAGMVGGVEIEAK
jgi:hypothetical protein